MDANNRFCFFYQVKNSLFLLLSFSLLLFFSFRYRFSFNYEIDINDQYYLILVWPITLMIVLLHGIQTRFLYSVYQICYILFMFFASCVELFSKFYNWGNEHFSVIISVLAATGVLLFLNKRKVIYVVLITLTLLFVYELYLGLGQYINAIDVSANIALDLKGSFQNSGIFAIYLVTQLPIVYHILVDLRKRVNINGTLRIVPLLGKIRIILFVVLLSLSLWLIFITKSRTAYLSMILTMLIWGWPYIRSNVWVMVKKIRGIWLCIFAVLVFGLISCFGYYLFSLKKISAIGRLMKTHITTGHLDEHFWLGTGLGRFSWYYPQWQADYFSLTENPPESYYMSAGESFLLFNEPVQLFYEIGFWGFVTLIVGFTWFFKLDTKSHAPLFKCCKIVVAAILVAGITSYSLHVNLFIWLLLFSFFIVIAIRAAESSVISIQGYGYALRRAIHLSNIMAIIVLFITTISGIRQYISFLNWNSTKENTSNNLVSYAGLVTHLRHNGKFLLQHANVLHLEGRTEDAILHLETAREYYISRAVSESLIESYVAGGKLDRAIQEAKWLCDFLPNKFKPKVKLMNLYMAVGEYKNAKIIAASILSAKIKVHTSEIDRIRGSAKKVLEM